MGDNYTLKYRTFDTLVKEAYSDFQKYYQSGLIETHQLIKIAKKVNYELGLRINQTKEEVLEVEKGRVRLPNDFYTFNYGFICNEFEIKVPDIQGTHIEEKQLGIPAYQWVPSHIDTCTDPVEPEPCSPCPTCQSPSPCNCTEPSCAPEPRVCLNCKGEEWELIQKVKFQTRVYKEFYPLQLLSSSQDVECGCPNLYMTAPNTGWIKDGWLYTNFEKGKVYINYQGMLEDNDGNLLVVDHDLINEFYEYALKKRILENLVMNDEPVNPLKIQLIEKGYRDARIAAISLVRMPNFSELKKVYESNRKAQYSKYYDMFSKFSGFNRERFYNYGLGFIRQ